MIAFTQQDMEGVSNEFREISEMIARVFTGAERTPAGRAVATCFDRLNEAHFWVNQAMSILHDMPDMADQAAESAANEGTLRMPGVEK